MTEVCRIIGVLDDGPASLSAAALGHIQQADLIIGGGRTLELFADHFAPHAERRDLTGKLAQVPDWIRQKQAEGRRVAVLATGDPLCHGIGGYLQSRLCIEACEIIPNVSTVQLACARLGLPWQDLKICSVHTRDTGEWHAAAGPEHGLYSLLRQIRRHDRLAVFTSPANSPDRIARLLLSVGLDQHFQLAVAERLQQSGERLAILDAADAAHQHFAEPNLLLMWRQRASRSPVQFGLADSEFAQRTPEKGLITKREVRAVSLARLQLRSNSIVWDIGAGSGAVGLEAARLAPEGHVYAVEKNSDDVALASVNRQQLEVDNYTLLHAKAPAGLDQWPPPDAVFIGGSGGELPALIRLCLQRLAAGGWLVMNFVTLENLATAVATLRDCGVSWDVTQLQAARSKPLLDMHRLAAENPVWIVSAQATERSHE